MRILHVSSDRRFGGASRYVLGLLRAEAFREDELALAAPAGPLLQTARSEGIRCLELPGADRSLDRASTRLLTEFLRREGPFDIVHSHASLSARLAARLTRTPVVATVHGPDAPPGGPLRESLRILLQPGRPNVSPLPAGLVRRWHRYLAGRLADRLVAVSAAVGDTLVRNGVPAEMVRVVRNGIDPEPYLGADPSRAEGLRTELGLAGSTVVLVLARLVPEKGHDVLLEALRDLPGVTALMVGAGPAEVSLRTRAAELGLSDRVRWLGFREDIPLLLAAADVLVLPSRQEGLPLAVLEAMAAARPVVATAVGGTPEAVLHGETGLLVPPDDAKALEAALRRYREDPEERRRHGLAGRERLLAEFTLEKMAVALRGIYLELGT